MKKACMMLLVTLYITTTGCSNIIDKNEQENNQKEIMLQEQEQKQVKIIEKKENTYSEFIDLTINLPQVKAMENKEIQEQLNNQLMDRYNLKYSMEKEAKDVAKDLKEREIPFHPYELAIDYSVSFNQNEVLSLITMVYTYEGGVHGMTEKTSYNLDIDSGELLSLKSIFKEGINYKDIVNKEISRQIGENPDYFFSGEQGFTGISDNQNFYIKEGKIVVYFSLYEIAPYVAGIPEFEIDVDIFNDSLKPRYLEKIKINSDNTK